MSVWTAWILIVIAAFLVHYDMFVQVRYGYDTTISAVMLDASRRWPLLPFLLGLLIGHIIWPQK